jgi:ABC-type transport system involved in multi-copper enzyme maturation permease subunit
MSKFNAIFADSLLEIRARKIFYLYWVVTLIVVIVFLLMPNFKIDGVDLFESEMFPPELMDQAVSRFFDFFFGIMILLMVFGSAGLLPSFVAKGRVELTLSKPMDRYRLLAMKFFSVYIIMCAILAISAIIIWGVLSIRLGSSSWLFFLGLLLSFVQFFAVYSIVFLLGMASNSGAMAIMGYFIIRIVTGLLAGREAVYQFLGESIWTTILDAIYHVLPKIGELASNYVPLMQGQGIAKTYPVYSTVGISIVCLLATALIFYRRDY